LCHGCHDAAQRRTRYSASIPATITIAADRERVAERVAEAVADRVRIGLWLVFASVALFVIANFALDPADPTRLYAMQGVLGAGTLALLAVLRRPSARPFARWIGVAAAVGTYVCSGYMGIALGDDTAFVLLAAALAVGAATFVPWGIAGQVPVAVAGIWTVTFYTSSIHGDLAALGSPSTIAIAVVLSVSIYLARVLRQHEWIIAEHEVRLERSREEMRALSMRLVSLQEAERAHISRELHDELGQLLVAIKLEIARATTVAGKSAPELGEGLSRALTVVDKTIQSVRTITKRLRPTVIDDLGLAPALESLVRDLRERTQIDWELEVDQAELDLPRDRAMAVFRIIQEAMTNVAQHACATRCSVRFARDGCTLVLTVEDDGRGITDAEASDPKSLGLIGMRERARNWGGDVEITGEGGRGTTIRVHMPAGSPA
jgi:signal transduction histidine kinase